jgi:hypothetical protein
MPEHFYPGPYVYNIFNPLIFQRLQYALAEGVGNPQVTHCPRQPWKL